MRKVLALVCCFLATAFGAAAGFAHVHEAGEHHEGSSGLHLDHGHLGRADTHAHDHGHHHDHHGEGHDHDHGASDASGHAGVTTHEHHHDSVDIGASATRSLGSNARPGVAIIAQGIHVEPATSRLARVGPADAVPPEPPDKVPPRLRAPPA